MPKTSVGGVPLTVHLDAASAVPLHRQLYEGVREAILRGALEAGARLPATRTLAADLGVSRNTVLAAFEQLLAEGYVEARVGSGTCVSRELPRAPVPPAGSRRDGGAACGRPAASRRAARLGAVEAAWVRHDARPFQPGPTALAAFPFKLWARLTARHWRRAPVGLLSYGDPAGYRPLREAIAAYIGPARGVRCTFDQIILTGAAQCAIASVALALLDEGDAVWFENPGCLSARGTLIAAGSRLVPVPVDEQGLDVGAGVARCPDARLAFVTPSHQAPLGVTMSLPRRLALLEWARRSGAWILEHDWGCEFRHSGRPLSALQGLDRHGRVLYSGTFAQVMFPGLRLGYLVVPPDLVDVCMTARAMVDRLPVSVDQAVLTDFIVEGHFVRHLRRMRALYAERQAVLVRAAERHLGGLLEVKPAEAGTHLVGWLPAGVSDTAAAQKAARQGVATVPVSAYAIEPPKRGGLLLGYCALQPKQIWEGARLLAGALS